MCLSLVANNNKNSSNNNDVVVQTKPTAVEVFEQALLPVLELHDEKSTENSNSNSHGNRNSSTTTGKRRKMSRTDSPSTCSFDVATLLDAIQREAAYEHYQQQLLLLDEEAEDEVASKASSSSYDDFDFIDISESPEESLLFPALFSAADDDREQDQVAPVPLVLEQPMEKRGSLGKRSRGLIRSQTVASNLCLLG